MNRSKIRTFLVLAGVLFLSACVATGGARYSTDPAAARIQALTDFCIGYGALRDAATNFILVDTARASPVLSEGLIDGYSEARSYIKPFCSPKFDPQGEAFDLDNLEKQLVKIRIVLLQREQQ